MNSGCLGPICISSWAFNPQLGFGPLPLEGPLDPTAYSGVLDMDVEPGVDPLLPRGWKRRARQ